MTVAPKFVSLIVNQETGDTWEQASTDSFAAAARASRMSTDDSQWASVEYVRGDIHDSTMNQLGTRNGDLWVAKENSDVHRDALEKIKQEILDRGVFELRWVLDICEEAISNGVSFTNMEHEDG